MRKNTGFLPCNYAYHIRKYAQKFLKTDICNIANINNIQNQESLKMNTNRRRLGTNRTSLIGSNLRDFFPVVRQSLTISLF